LGFSVVKTIKATPKLFTIGGHLSELYFEDLADLTMDSSMTRAVLVGAHDGAVNHRIFVVGLGGQVLEETLPHPFIGPAAEALVRVLPVAKRFWQIAPRNSGALAVEHRFDEAAIVIGGDADIAGFCRAAGP
jgi:hypothetical protein